MDSLIWDAVKFMGGFALAIISAMLLHIRGQEKTHSDADVSLQDITTREAGRLVLDLREELDRFISRTDRLEARLEAEKEQCVEKLLAMEQKIESLARQVRDISEPQ